MRFPTTRLFVAVAVTVIIVAHSGCRMCCPPLMGHSPICGGFGPCCESCNSLRRSGSILNDVPPVEEAIYVEDPQLAGEVPMNQQATYLAPSTSTDGEMVVEDGYGSSGPILGGPSGVDGLPPGAQIISVDDRKVEPEGEPAVAPRPR